jgi:hypothetical protein
MVDGAHPLMFSVAELLAKTLLDNPQRFGIGIFSGSERISSCKSSISPKVSNGIP